MATKKQYLRVLLFFFIVLNLALPVQAKHKKKTKIKRPIAESVNAAIKKSAKEQKKIRVKLDFEEENRFQTWNERKQETIKISHTGTSSVQPVDIGRPDFTMEEVGEDQSGLNKLRSTVHEEPTDIDFESELREVSSHKN